MRRASRMRGIRGWGVGLALWAGLLTGCAGDQPKSPPPTRAIQEDSDRAFEHLRQEEQERGAAPADHP